ncbi:MAG: 50S ribosomal protein L32 [Dehalococcoidia bacterium]
MAPLPKKKHSRARKGGRAAHHALTLTASSVCPCPRKLRVPPHRACPECGNYKGRTLPGNWASDNLQASTAPRPTA